MVWFDFVYYKIVAKGFFFNPYLKGKNQVFSSRSSRWQQLSINIFYSEGELNMPCIQGLDEQKKAFDDICRILKELKGINSFLELKNPTKIYEISFQVLVSDEEEEEINLTENGKNSKKKKPKYTRYSAPFICPNDEVLRDGIMLYKKSKVDIVRELASKFNIYLDAEDEEILRLD